MKCNYVIFRISLVVVCAFMLWSCASTKQVSYLQDLKSGVPADVANPAVIKLLPEDKISVVVSSKDRNLSDLFNLPYVNRQLGQLEGTSSTTQGVLGYTVDSQGCIAIPVLGKVAVAGKTRQEAAEAIRNELIAKNLIKDCVVTVDFLNLTVSVIGEVSKPGRYSIEKDRLSVLDAIGMAGDLTIYGKRDNVTVIRTDGDGRQTPYKIDLCSAKDLYTSPAFYLQQNDVVYVEPNNTRARQSTTNGNNVISTSFWLSVASLLTTIAVLIVK